MHANIRLAGAYTRPHVDRVAGIRSILQTRFVWRLLLPALTAGAIARGDDATNAFKPALPDFSRYMQGRFVYERNCAVCHGPTGKGDGDMGRELVPKPRSFRTGIFKYRTTPADALPTNADLVKTIRNGVATTSMPIFDKLSQNDVDAVVEYLKFFSRRWNDPANYAPPLRLPPTPTWINTAESRREASAAGRELFMTACASCHGETGTGNGPAAATLVDAWGQPTKPRNIRAEPCRTGDRPEDFYRLLVTGIGGTPMPAFGETFTEDQRWKIVAWLLDLRSEPPQKGAAAAQ